ncbi:MlaE family ABC transporter permease [Rickettsiella grylli]|uniref:ABC transporter, permease n=1 Tax=Rickettsiella grylli TaxID=59196 RepID=A8PLZ2_9COXI|nr:ABC transporter permease [Rickettsiella grylli]EDP46346.1 ABC transporter, permease [Rickettsiella grylli]
MSNLSATITLSKQGNHQIDCQGAWTLSGIRKKNLDQSFQKLNRHIESPLILNAAFITQMDSSGAWQLYQWKKQLAKKRKVHLIGLNSKHQALFGMIETAAEQIKPLPREKTFRGLGLLGKKSIEQWNELKSYLAFIGKNFISACHAFLHPRQLRVRAILGIIENTGLDALGIIALLSFMIGIVLTYQMGFQLKNFGATRFIIDLLGLAILREFSPLLTAIMVAGRSGSAFTAQLGMMKIKEEIDALNTMGVLPRQLLILPRLWGLLLALPLLTVWADIFGLLGGMAMTHNMMNISYLDFLHRFPKVVSLSSLIIGVGKAPVFALIIASTACFQGLRVSGSADSVGRQTTRSVVQGIFFIIVADALFSILFSTLNI